MAVLGLAMGKFTLFNFLYKQYDTAISRAPNGPKWDPPGPSGPKLNFRHGHNREMVEDERCRLEPIENPFSPRVLPMSPV